MQLLEGALARFSQQLHWNSLLVEIAEVGKESFEQLKSGVKLTPYLRYGTTDKFRFEILPRRDY